MTTVLIALDQSDASHAAALAAAELFGPEATYLAINVADAPIDETGFTYGYAFPAVMPSTVVEPLSDRVYETVTRARAEAARLSNEVGLAAKPIGDIGDPATAIVEAADEHAADVIVTGWHDRSWFRNLIETPVGDSVVSKSRVPVLIVPFHEES